MKVIISGDSLQELTKISSKSIQLIITSPPYNIGKEYEQTKPLDTYKKWIVEHLFEFARVLKSSGSLCIQLGNYVDNGHVYPLDCVLFNDFTEIGLIPRNRIVWHLGHGLHCQKRFSGRHETILWFTKTDDYIFNLDSVRVPSKYPAKKHYKGAKKGQLSGNPLGKNPSDVWDIPNVKHNHPEKTEHPCQFPEALSDRLVLALSNAGDTILDCFAGSGTVGMSANKANREYILIDNMPNYIQIIKNRLN